MRASRLLQILLRLQAHGLATAQSLAEECEVSVRTIYRDVDALSAAGVPIYADRGPRGGYRLLDGYRTRLNGLSAREAEAMFLSGLPGAAHSLGLGSSMAAAQLKMVAALPTAMRSAAENMRARFHLDAPHWFHSAENPPHLRELFDAVGNDRMIDILYRSWKSETKRRLLPLGLVLKGGAWYLAGAVSESVRTYHVGRIRDLRVLEERGARPDGFDLAAYWSESTCRLESELYPDEATIRLSPVGVRIASGILPPYVRSKMRLLEEDERGFRLATLPVGTSWAAIGELLAFGAELEVLRPADLRQRVADTIAGMAALYGGLTQPWTEPACADAIPLRQLSSEQR